MRISIAVCAVLVMAGCDQLGLTGWGAQLQSDVENLDLVADTQRAFAAQYQDQPFDTGAVSVLVTEEGALRTYSLTPCSANTQICGSRRGSLDQQLDYDVVSGAYPGRTFYLFPGGDGYMLRNGTRYPLAWD